MLVWWVCYAQTGCLQQQECIFSPFLGKKPEIEVLVGLVFFLKLLSLVCRWLCYPCDFTWSFFCMRSYVSLIFFFFCNKETSHLGIGFSLIASFSVNYFYKGPISKYSLRCWGLGIQHTNFERTHRAHNWASYG